MLEENSLGVILIIVAILTISVSYLESFRRLKQPTLMYVVLPKSRFPNLYNSSS